VTNGVSLRVRLVDPGALRLRFVPLAVGVWPSIRCGSRPRGVCSKTTTATATVTATVTNGVSLRVRLVDPGALRLPFVTLRVGVRPFVR
jgi:hypothetical protein